MTDEVIDEQPIFNCDSTRIPLSALNISSRLLLSASLNPEQLITTESGLARDYRGLAELCGFSYWDIKNFQRASDPCKALLEAIDAKRFTNNVDNNEYSFQDLIAMLEQIERFDVIDDLQPYLNIDAKKFLNRPHNGGSLDKHLFETNLSFSGSRQFANKPQFSITSNESDSHLTIDDALNSDVLTKYDAYVCYADNDYEFVKLLTSYLESPAIGLKLFVRDRDLLVGTWEYEAFTRLIESRCERMVIILTPDFLNSPECEYQTRFAAGLAVERRNRILIPVIYKPCELPSILKIVTKIDFVKSNGIQDWMWRKLVISIRSSTKSELIPSKHKQLEFPKTPSPSSSTQSLDSASLAPFPIVPTAPPLYSSKISITEIPTPLVSTTLSPNDNTSKSSNLSTSPTTVKPKKNWYKSIKQKITGGSSASIESNGYQSLNK